MAGNSLGTAYVQVVPKLKAGALSGLGQQAGSGFAAGFGDALKGLGSLLASAAIVKGIYDIGKAAMDSYADYEQLIGGVETLYKEHADALVANAQRAYMTAGLSANEYMETSTSFAAALVSSLGGDTAEAARLADVAITDMSDNANKMGSSMQSIQDAYQGFAKQNYTMLDNLKLGYGGTKTEMERLLADAEAISGIHFDIESYSDVVSAIHVIQEEMGIAGTTAEEAATTISGSWGMLQGSWANLLTSLAGGGDEIDVAVKNVFDSLATWLGNVVPRIGEIAMGIFSAIPEMASEAMERLPELVAGFIRDAFGDDAADAALGFIDAIQGIGAEIGELVSGVMDAISPFTEFLSGQGEAFGGMMERIQGHLADLQPHLETMGELWDGFKEAIIGLYEAAAPVAAEFFGYLGSAIAGLLPIVASIAEVFLAVATAVIDAITFLVNDAQNGFEGLKSMIGGIFEGIRSTVANVWNNIMGAIGSVVDAISNKVSSVFNAVKSTVANVWEGVKNAIMTPINAAKDAVRNAIDAIKGFFSFEFKWPHIPLPHFSISGSINPLDWLSGGLPKIGIEWYGAGGFYSKPTILLPGVGERGTELAWPSYEPYFSKYAAAIAERMPAHGGAVNIYIDGLRVNDDPAIRQAAIDFAYALKARERGYVG